MSPKVISCSYCGKIISEDALFIKERKLVKCPACGSQRNWKSGTRDTPFGKTQCYIPK